MPVIPHDRLQGLVAKLLVANGASEDAAAIVMSKHQSAWETIALRALLPPCRSLVSR